MKKDLLPGEWEWSRRTWNVYMNVGAGTLSFYESGWTDMSSIPQPGDPSNWLLRGGEMRTVPE